MANGDLARALAYQSNLQSDTRALFRQWMNNVTQSNERDKQRLYESTIRDEDRKISEGIREENKRQYLSEWNRNETRYQDKIRTEREERNEERDRILISRGLREPLDKRVQYFNNLVDSGRMKSTFGYDLLEGEISHASSEFGRANASIQGLDIYKLNNFEYTHLENQYLSGEFDKAFETLDKVIDRKVDPKMNPALNASVKNIQAQIEFLNKTLVDPYNILDDKKKIELGNQRIQLQAKQSELLAPLSFLKGEGGEVDSTDYGLFQINDKTFDKHSQSFFGKRTQRLSPEENIRFASWIVKNQPRKVGDSKSGWNNWSVILNDSYKQYLNKSDEYYMAGGLSESNLRLIEQEFGDDAQKAKAVMFAESGGKHSSINQNLAGGGARTGEIENITKFKPFEIGGKWNQMAIDYMAAELGISKEKLKKDYGTYISSNFIQKYSGRPNLDPKRAKEKLISFTDELKKVPTLKFTVPSGRFKGKQLNKSIVQQLLKEREKSIASRTAVSGRPIFGGGPTYEWLDTFAEELGFFAAEDLLSDPGVKAMKDFYSGKKPQAGQIDFTKPFTVTR
tara:strand:- start:36 stop:1736 length:1701 start_codon:yes stop_codon:yes gene_type:complete